MLACGAGGKDKLLDRAGYGVEAGHLLRPEMNLKGPGLKSQISKSQAHRLRQAGGKAFPYLEPASWHTEGWCHAPDTVSCLGHMVNVLMGHGDGQRGASTQPTLARMVSPFSGL